MVSTSVGRANLPGKLPRWPARKWIGWLEDLGFQPKVQRRGTGHVQMEDPNTGRKIAVPAPRRKGDVVHPYIAAKIMKAALDSY